MKTSKINYMKLKFPYVSARVFTYTYTCTLTFDSGTSKAERETS